MKTESQLLGEKVVSLLGLKPISCGENKGWYKTSYGTKSLEGLGATIKRLVREAGQTNNIEA